MRKVTIATKPANLGPCINCTKTIILLKANGVKPEQIKKVTIPANKLKAAGFLSYPVIMPTSDIESKHDFDGFNPAKVHQLAQYLTGKSNNI